jgi:hypothetical protein
MSNKDAYFFLLPYTYCTCGAWLPMLASHKTQRLALQLTLCPLFSLRYVAVSLGPLFGLFARLYTTRFTTPSHISLALEMGIHAGDDSVQLLFNIIKRGQIDGQ